MLNSIHLINEFKQNHDSQSLVEGISQMRMALDAFSEPDDETEEFCVTALTNLGTTLCAWFEESRDTPALVEAIQLHREALDLRPPGHPERALMLNNLGKSLLMWYQHVRDTTALAWSIERLQEAIALLPPGHPDLGTCMSNLASSLFELFRIKQAGDVMEIGATLTSSAARLEGMLELLPSDHPDRSSIMGYISSSLSELTTFKQGESSAILDISILRYHQSLNHSQLDDPDVADRILGLSEAYIAKFSPRQGCDELTQAMNYAQQFLSLYPQGHPARYRAHSLIATILLQDSRYFNWVSAVEHAMLSVEDGAASYRDRLKSSIRLLLLVEQVTMTRSLEISRDHELAHSPRVLDIYKCTIDLLPRVAEPWLSTSSRLRELSDSESLCRHAAIRAIMLNDYQTAIELFEQGKTVFWQQAMEVRSYDPEDFFDETRQLVKTIESSDSDQLPPGHREQAIEEKRQSYLRLREQCSDPFFIIHRLADIGGFDRLAKATENGPVVILLDWYLAPFALIIESRESVRALRLHINSEQISQLLRSSNLHSAPTSGSRMSDDACDRPRGEGPSPVDITELLAQIWYDIVRPVIEELNLEVSFLCDPCA
jgi:tetratricopeptide (TPR) repeat protein